MRPSRLAQPTRRPCAYGGRWVSPLHSEGPWAAPAAALPSPSTTARPPAAASTPPPGPTPPTYPLTEPHLDLHSAVLFDQLGLNTYLIAENFTFSGAEPRPPLFGFDIMASAAWPTRATATINVSLARVQHKQVRKRSSCTPRRGPDAPHTCGCCLLHPSPCAPLPGAALAQAPAGRRGGVGPARAAGALPEAGGAGGGGG
jgi:hypothetical protein